ncbi:hypothetical protein A2U01_0098234, partial [Trifolium medium]|nr:hypothetical protein [Trifolium medium]
MLLCVSEVEARRWMRFMEDLVEATLGRDHWL